MDKDFSSYHSNLGFNSYEDGDHEASYPVRPRPVSQHQNRLPPPSLSASIFAVSLQGNQRSEAAVSGESSSNQNGSILRIEDNDQNGPSRRFPTSDNLTQADSNMRPGSSLQDDLQLLSASGFNSHQDDSKHFFVNTADTVATSIEMQDWESTAYPEPIKFIDRKTGTQYNPGGEPIVYPEDNGPLKHSAEGYPQPAAHSSPSIDATHALPNATAHYNDNRESYPHANPGYPTDGGNTNPLYSTGYFKNTENPAYTPSGFPTGYIPPKVNSYRYNQGSASNQESDVSNQASDVSVVVQPSSSSDTNNMAMMTPTPNITNYVPLSIFVAFLCCTLFGIHAFKDAREAQRLKKLGQYEEAKQKASDACILNCYGILVGIMVLGGVIGLLYWRLMT